MKTWCSRSQPFSKQTVGKTVCENSILEKKITEWIKDEVVATNTPFNEKTIKEKVITIEYEKKFVR